MSKKIEVALFDFDKTLIPKSSGTYLVQSFLNIGLISHFFALKLLFIQLAYRFGLVDMEAVMNKSILIADGMKREEFHQILMKLYDKKLKSMLHPEAKKAIEEHKVNVIIRKKANKCFLKQ